MGDQKHKRNISLGNNVEDDRYKKDLSTFIVFLMWFIGIDLSLKFFGLLIRLLKMF